MAVTSRKAGTPAAKLRLGVPIERPDAALRLFCLPCAGGGAWMFSRWQDQLPSFIEVCPVYLSGRDVCHSQRPFHSIRPLVADLARALLPYLDKPFALFGHSLGALVCFEAARELRQEYGIESSHLFVSACPPPQRFASKFSGGHLQVPESVDELCRLFSIPPSLITNPELVRLMRPTLQADLDICTTYEYTEDLPFDFPITAFGGLEDSKVTSGELEDWRLQTAARFDLRMFGGGHFFLHTAEEMFMESLANDLSLLYGARTADALNAF